MRKTLVIAAGSIVVCGMILVTIELSSLPSVDAGPPMDFQATFSAVDSVTDPTNVVASEPEWWFQYLDEDGNVHFTKWADEVPVEWWGHAGWVLLDVPPPADPAQARALRKLQAAATGSAEPAE